MLLFSWNVFQQRVLAVYFDLITAVNTTTTTAAAAAILKKIVWQNARALFGSILTC